MLLGYLVGWVQKKWKMGEHAWLSWILDDKLQLQRLVSSHFYYRFDLKGINS